MINPKSSAIGFMLIALISTHSYGNDKTDSVSKAAATFMEDLIKKETLEGNSVDINRVVSNISNILRNKQLAADMRALQEKNELISSSQRDQELIFLNSLADLPFMSQMGNALFYTPSLDPEAWASEKPLNTDTVTFSITAKTHMNKKIAELQNQRVTAKVEDLPNGLALLILDMLIGESRKAYLPSWTMYGSKPKGVVPGYSTIIADVMLLNIRKGAVDARDHKGDDVRVERGAVFSSTPTSEPTKTQK